MKKIREGNRSRILKVLVPNIIILRDVLYTIRLPLLLIKNLCTQDYISHFILTHSA